MLPRTGIAFFLGVLSVQQMPELPSVVWLWAALPLAAALGWYRRLPDRFILLSFTVGVLWAWGFAHLRLAQSLPPELISRNLDVQGYIASIPDIREDSMRFEFEIVDQAQQDSRARLPLPFKVRLNWYARGEQPLPAVGAGELRRFTIRLKPPNGFFNPGGFDYEGWLFGQGIRATGYVRAELPIKGVAGKAALLEPPLRHQLDYWRQRLLEHIYPLTPATHNRGIIAGLVLGHRTDITQEQWRLLLETGTNHLIAISGLHIGLIAGLFYAAVMRLGGLLPAAPGAWPRQRLAALVAYVAAVIYAMLADLALPTQRALIMLGVGLTAILAYRQLRPGHALLLALVLVALFDPFAVLNPGFWLSFGAVAVLIYMAVGRRIVRQRDERVISTLLRRGWLWGKLQWLLLLGILPLSLVWFGRVAVGGVAANLIAIPLVGAIVVPLVLLATAVSLLSASLAEWLFQVADWLLNVFWHWLEWVSALPFNLWSPPAPSGWALLCACTGLVLLLAPRGLPGRWVGVLWLLPLLLSKPPVPGTGEFWLTALDVGQGTAVVVQTRQHTLVYDAGPRFSAGFNTGEAVVLPFLRALGIDRVDRLLISHGDNDHIGGAWGLLERIPVGSVLTSVPERFAFEPIMSRDGRAGFRSCKTGTSDDPCRSYSGAPGGSAPVMSRDGRYSGAPGGSAPVEGCRAGQQWRWDEVTFEILHPDAPGEGNNASCVLQITAAGGRALLPGDIEKQAEQRLLRSGRLSPVGLLVAPHHGSRTSSTTAFVDALRPIHVVFTAGYLNRYGFPKSEVVDRYKLHNTELWVTGNEGAVSFGVSSKGVYPRMAYRREAGKYWHRKP